MKAIYCLVVFGLLAAVNTLEVNRCGDTRLMKCSIVYKDEVCGFTGIGREQLRSNFQNHCLACVMGKAQFTVHGKCEDLEKDTYICSPTDKEIDGCTEEYQPVCGFFNSEVKCKKAPCAQTYENRCNACTQPNVSYVKKGKCENY